MTTVGEASTGHEVETESWEPRVEAGSSLARSTYVNRGRLFLWREELMINEPWFLHSGSNAAIVGAHIVNHPLEDLFDPLAEWLELNGVTLKYLFLFPPHLNFPDHAHQLLKQFDGLELVLPHGWQTWFEKNLPSSSFPHIQDRWKAIMDEGHVFHDSSLPQLKLGEMTLELVQARLRTSLDYVVVDNKRAFAPGFGLGKKNSVRSHTMGTYEELRRTLESRGIEVSSWIDVVSC